MNEQIQTISNPGYAVQPSNSASQTGEQYSERDRTLKLNSQDSKEQQESQKPDEEVLNEKDLETLVSEAQEKYEAKGIKLNFSVHEETGQIQVEVVNSADDKVIRKIPRDEMLKLAAQMKEMAGTLLDRSI